MSSQEYKNIVDKAQVCVINTAYVYSRALQFGEDTQLLHDNMVEANAYLKIISRYKYNPEPIKSKFRMLLGDGSDMLFDGFSMLSFSSKELCVPVHPDQVNCLTEMEINSIVERIAILNSKCNC